SYSILAVSRGPSLDKPVLAPFRAHGHLSYLIVSGQPRLERVPIGRKTKEGGQASRLHRPVCDRLGQTYVPGGGVPPIPFSTSAFMIEMTPGPMMMTKMAGKMKKTSGKS